MSEGVRDGAQLLCRRDHVVKGGLGVAHLAKDLVGGGGCHIPGDVHAALKEDALVCGDLEVALLGVGLIVVHLKGLDVSVEVEHKSVVDGHDCSRGGWNDVLGGFA